MPSQTRAFLFSDLRGYSAYTERHGDKAARELLARYRRAVRDVIATFHGAEIRTEGDSFYVVFDSVSNAVHAGLGILSSLERENAAERAQPINAGIGVHAGEAEDSDEGIVSGAVNVAARICSQAEPGELLVSDTVRALTRTYLDVTFVPRGRRRLKGIAEPVALYRVTAGKPAGAAGPSPRLRRPAPSRAWLARGAIALAAAIVVAGIAVLGGTLMREGVAGEDPSPASTVVPSGSQVSPGTSLAASSSASLPPFPTDAEQALLGIVDDGSWDQCARPEDGPVYRIPRPSVAGFAPVHVRFLAGVECRLGGISAPDELRVWELRETEGRTIEQDEYAAPNAIVTQKANAAPMTTCAQQVPALEEWSFGENSGLLTCYETNTGDAVLWWSYEGTDIVGTAIRADRDMTALLDWWTANARFTP